MSAPILQVLENAVRATMNILQNPAGWPAFAGHDTERVMRTVHLGWV
jgi:hypothetical protein